MDRRDFVGFGGIRLAGDAFGSPESPPVLLLPSGVSTPVGFQASVAV